MSLQTNKLLLVAVI